LGFKGQNRQIIVREWAKNGPNMLNMGKNTPQTTIFMIKSPKNTEFHSKKLNFYSKITQNYSKTLQT
jgi:hypothetical protein